MAGCEHRGTLRESCAPSDDDSECSVWLGAQSAASPGYTVLCGAAVRSRDCESARICEARCADAVVSVSIRLAASSASSA